MKQRQEREGMEREREVDKEERSSEGVRGGEYKRQIKVTEREGEGKLTWVVDTHDLGGGNS